jgi:FlgN protein.
VSFRELLASLEQLHAQYARLLELGAAKKDQVIQNRLNELMATTAKESRIIKQIVESERACRQWMKQFQQDMGVRPKLRITLSEIERMVFSVEERQQLAAIRQKLADVTESLKRVNEINQQLIRQSVSFVEFSLDLLADAPEEVTYKNPALDQGKRQWNGMFDTRA